MNFWAQYKRSLLLLLFVPGTLIWLVLLLWGERFSFDFYFDGSFHQHQSWFPRLFFFSYLFCRLLLPLIYCAWLIGFLLNRNIKSLTKWPLFLSLLFVLSFIIQYYFSIKVALYIGVPLICICMGALLSPYTILKHIPKPALPWFIVEKTGIFFLYMILCIILPRFHPFAKYTMFDKFSDTTFVYLLRDDNELLIPINKYSSLTYDEFFTIGESIVQCHNKGAIKDSELGTILLNEFKKNRNTEKILTDSISLNKLEFFLKDNRIISNEKKLGVYDTKQLVF